MSDRKISWHIRDGKQIAGIEDTKTGWAVVDGNDKVTLSIQGYTSEARSKIIEEYERIVNGDHS